MGKWFDPWSEDGVSLTLFYELETGSACLENSLQMYSKNAYNLYYISTRQNSPVLFTNSVLKNHGIFAGILSVYPVEHERTQPLRAQYVPINGIFRLPSEPDREKAPMRIFNGQLHFDLGIRVTLFSTVKKGDKLHLTVKRS